MGKLFSLGVLVGFILKGSVCWGKEFTCEKYKLPVLLRNEWIYKGWDKDTKAIKTVKVREKPDLQSKIKDELKKGETVQSVEGFVLLRSLGKGRVVSDSIDPQELPGSSPSEESKNSFDDIKEGDVIPLVHYKGEGYFTACIGKNEFEVGDPHGSAGIKIEMGHSSEEVLLPIGVERWLRIVTPRNKEGFVNEEEEFLHQRE